MTNFNWCHGPNCHKKELQSRVRGSKGNKVLRTMKVKHRTPNTPNDYWFRHWWNYFCNQSCLMEFVEKHIQGMIALEPRKEPLETPINDPVKETSEYGWSNWNIEKKGVDSGNNIG
jgi:hypothetical protein